MMLSHLAWPYYQACITNSQSQIFCLHFVAFTRETFCDVQMPLSAACGCVQAVGLSALTTGSCGAGIGIRRACVLVGSQKTLPIAVTVLNGLAPQIGGSVGLAVIPCVVSHLVQIVMDSMLVSQWLKQDANMSGLKSSRLPRMAT